ncbi:MAG: TolC family protein [Deltaproteobacteria bacterium]|nr:MAG: TolC family protein [Deltaproteobacteria bacterium]
MKSLFLVLLTLVTSNTFAAASFDEALSAIMERSPDIPSSQAYLDASESSLLSQKLQLLPSVSAGWSKRETFESISERTGNFLKADFNLFKGGSHYNSWKSNSYGYDAAKAGLDKTKLDVEYGAVQVLLNYIQKAKDKEIFEELLKINQDSLKTTQSRFKQGLISQQEVIRAQVDLGLAKARLKAADIELNNAKSNLETLLGHTNLSLKWPLANDLMKMRLNKLSNLELDLDDRPDVKEARLNVLRDTHNVTSAKGSFLPRVDFSYTLSNDEVNGTNYDERTSLITISIPLFDGWQTVSSVKSSQYTLAASKKTLTTKERSAKSEWDMAKDNLIQAIETARERNSNMILSRKLYKANFRRFQQGRSSVNDLLVDQNRFLDSESQANSGWLQAHMAWLQFCHTMGQRLNNCNI